MKLTILLLLGLIATSTLTVDYGFPEEDDVLVLTDDNFKQALEKFEFILVEFYAPWCGHCKKLAPEFAKAAAELKTIESPIPLAKVDATENGEIAKEFGVQGYPTLKFFIKGSPIEFNGGRTHPEIVQWIKKKTGPPSVVLKDAAHLEELKKGNKVVVAFFGSEESDEFKVFQTTALTLDGVLFAHSADTSLLEANGGNSLTIFTQHDSAATHFAGEFNKDAILAQVAEIRFPIVMDFEGDEAIERVFGKENPAIVYFSDVDTDFTPIFTQAAQEDASNVDKPLIFFTSKVTTGLGKRLAEYVGVDAAVPSIWLVHPQNRDLSKFKHTGELTAEAVKAFVAEWRGDALEKHFKSEAIPETNDKPVKIIVGKNFDDIVVNSGKYVLVKFYAPWCGHCKKLAPIWDKVAEDLAGNDKLTLAKMDSTLNEVPGISVSGFPTLKLWIPGKTEPVDFAGDRTEEGITKFLKEQLGDDYSEAQEGL